MLFKLGYTIRRLDIHSKEPIEFLIEGSDKIKVILRRPNKEEIAIDHKTFNAFCDVVGEFEPTKKALPVFNAIIDGKRPQERLKAKKVEDMVIRDGSSYGLKYYPNPFISFVDKIKKQLSHPAKIAISFLRWRYAQEGPPAPISSRGLSWSNDDGNTWLPLPQNISVKCINPPSSKLFPGLISTNELKESISLGLGEPVYHELLREAKELKFDSPRSSILISLSAAEVAVKEVLYKRNPNGQWLIENIQSPPIVKIIKEYFPKIVPEEKFRKIKGKCESLTTELEKAIFIRNRVAHRGQSPPADEKVEEIIEVVGQLLWICDYCSGNEWSIEYITYNNFSS